mmetsp:Transcript_48580/g.72080  ORF Transcript_48580/g.72080 Transcript_48580/m.72080 type:complete len:172 (-) Transcript_48580:247-762(-)
MRSTPLALLGAILSCYALYVEHKHSAREEEEEPFEALCDIQSIGASCSSTFALPEGRLLSLFGVVPHGHLFDVPNAALGFIYYCFVLLSENFRLFGLSNKTSSRLNLLMGCAAMSTSVYLAYMLTVLNKLCLLCWATHVINAALLWNFVRKVQGRNKIGATKHATNGKKDL